MIIILVIKVAAEILFLQLQWQTVIYFIDELLPSDICRKSDHGCCPDGLTVAEGPNHEGCSTISDPIPSGFCAESAFGCCPDGVTTARSHNHEGCPDTRREEHLVTPQITIERSMMMLQTNILEYVGNTFHINILGEHLSYSEFPCFLSLTVVLTYG